MQNTSAKAYDLSRYEETYEPIPKKQARPRVTVRTTRKPKKSVSPLRLFCCGVLLLAVVCAGIYQNIVAVEMGDRLATANGELAVLQSRGEILKTQLESAVSTKSVEEFASLQLGMGKAERYQITYIRLSAPDRIEVAGPAGGSSLVGSVMGACADFVEYMSQK